MNLYEVLDLSSSCSFDDLRRQYHRLILEYHPDKSNSTTRNHFEKIQNAYRILSNVELRLKYDQEQDRHRLHTLPHTNIDRNDFDEEYSCRCGTILQIDQEISSNMIECPNCSMKIELLNK